MDLEQEMVCCSAQEEGAFRVCLNDISAAAETLETLLHGVRERECLGVLNRGVVRLLRLMQHRELSRRLSGKDVPPPDGLVELGELSRRVCAEGERLLARAEVSLRVQLPEASLRVAGDEQLLEHLLLLLISNGAKAAGPGGAVSVSLRETEGSVVLSVRDSGPGPSRRALDLQRGEEDLLPDLDPRAGAGRGLGLARQIAALHGGGLVMKLSARSGGGVMLSLPLHRGEGPLCRGRMYLPESGYGCALVELSELLPADFFLSGEMGC